MDGALDAGDEEEMERSEVMDDALGSTEDVSRDIISVTNFTSDKEGRCVMAGIGEQEQRKRTAKKTLKEGKGLKLSMWTINVGGLSGAWRVAHLVAALEGHLRPKVICLQETSCSDNQWLSLLRYMQGCGFKGFHTGGRQVGERHLNGNQYQWHRGIATFIEESLAANILGEHSWKGGQMHAIMVDRLMVLNYYVAPREEFIAQQACKCQDLLEEIQWAGRWIMLGDFNEPFPGSWIATLALLYGGWQPECHFDTTRWNGERCIDYAIANFDLPRLQVREEKVSDHLIVTCTFDYNYSQDVPQWRFQKDIRYNKPLWMNNVKWQQLFDFAFAEGQKENWQTCCSMVEKFMDWDQVGIDGEQVAVDYEWCFCCAQLSWAFANACRLALLDIPEAYQNIYEMRRVMHAANHFKIKGCKIQLQERTMPKKPIKLGQEQRRKLVRLGRLHELERRLQKGNRDKEAANLAKKLYGLELHEVQMREVTVELNELERSYEQEENDHKVEAIKGWKKQMCTNISAKSAWINKKGSKLSPSIDAGRFVTSTKMQAAEVLYDYWGQLWTSQKWTDEETPEKVNRLVERLKKPIENLKIGKGRPSLEIFRKQLGGIKGCAGIDGWGAEELKVVAASHAASCTIWKAMERWEVFVAVPNALKHCKLVHIPKKEKRVLTPSQFRPIAIMSAFWRAWSSAWMHSKWVHLWTKELFPNNITGGLVGAQGPEVMAAIIAHELNVKRHGLTMDFRHAFDTINVAAMEKVFQQILPKNTKRWFSLLFEQWKTMERWISIDSGVYPQSHRVQQGLPQGDPGSCVVMATMMLALKEMVDEDVQEDGSEVFQAIYMDDRTAVAKTVDTLKKVQKAWHQHAQEFHLIENPEKAQFVNMNKQGSAFEVLGTVVGNFQEKKQEDSRLMKRVKEIGVLYKKIGILPGGIHMKMKDVHIFARARLAYGWISASPKKDWVHKQEQTMWKTWAKLTYANAHMRRTVTGAHTSLRMIAFLRQLRLLSQRDKRLQEQGVEVTQCQLDKMVHKALEDLDWRFEDGKYVHDLCIDGFRIGDLVQDCIWRKVGHYVRESFRQQHYQLFLRSGRHEFNGLVLTPYDSLRRKMAWQWAGKDGLAILLIQGAVQSPNVRLASSGIDSCCHVCGEPHPTWDHLWLCFTGEAAPMDYLLRRHLWPRDAKDLHLCTSFLNGMRSFCEQ